MATESNNLIINTNSLRVLLDGETPADIVTAFVKSTAIQAYPCGRRRGISGSTHIPFDPEARLNTEANNRKHTGLNGYTQTYLKDWATAADGTTQKLNLVLNGYSFSIDTEGITYSAFGNTIADRVKAHLRDVLRIEAGEVDSQINNLTHLYANILIEEAQLFAGDPKNYYTDVLRDHINTDVAPEAALDLLGDTGDYYFSGLSFSFAPLTGKQYQEDELRTYSVHPTSVLRDSEDINQIWVSLCFLEKGEPDEDGNPTWHIYQPALLPRIAHGDSEDSIVVTGQTLAKDDVTVIGNIEVQKDTSRIEATGDITAENNITAEHDLIAENDLSVVKNGTIQGNLVIGTREAENDPALSNGDLFAKNSITTPVSNITNTLNVQSNDENSPATANIDYADIADTDIETAEIVTASIDDATITTAHVTVQLKVRKPKSEDPETAADPGAVGETELVAEADIEKAHIDNADIDYSYIDDTDITNAEIATAVITEGTVTNTLKVQNTYTKDAQLTADKIKATELAEFTKTEVTGTFTATTELTETDTEGNPSPVNNINVNRGYVKTFTADTVDAETSVEAPEITATKALYQYKDADTIMNVPIIELATIKENEGEENEKIYYQLQISRIGAKTET